MKKLKLQNQSYKELLIAFKAWLKVLGYSKSACKNYPLYLQEFLFHMEQAGYCDLSTITISSVKEYYRYLQERPNNITYGL